MELLVDPLTVLEKLFLLCFYNIHKIVRKDMRKTVKIMVLFEVTVMDVKIFRIIFLRLKFRTCKFSMTKISFHRSRPSSCTWGVSKLQRSSPHKPGVIDLFFWFSDRLGLFTWNISCGKNLVLRGLPGGHQSGTVNCFFSVVFGKFSTADSTQMIST